MRPTSSFVLRQAIASLCGCALMMTSVAALSQEQTTRRYDIAPQGLDEALTQYGLQSGRNIYFRGEQIGERQSEGLQGDYSAEEALIRLLSGTDIRYEVADDGTILITRAQEGADRSPSLHGGRSKKL